MMRIQKHALLALLALLNPDVVAVPSPAAYLPTTPTTQQSPWWRGLSNRLIELIWNTSRHDQSSRAYERLQIGLPAQTTLARYGSDLVLRFNITTAEEAKSIGDAANTLLLDVWDFTHDWVDVRLSRDLVPSLLGLLPKSLEHSHTPLLRERDLAYAVYDTYPTSAPSQTSNAVPMALDRQFTTSVQRTTEHDETSVFFHEYRPLTVIEPWMRLMSSLFPTHVRLVSIGKSFEGRDILALRLGVRPENYWDPQSPKRQTVLITGGLHAREWISTSTVNYVAYHLITNYGKSDSITGLLEEYDFVFVPTVNPDGYEYTWNTDRLWRKNRQQTAVRFCHGIDLDHGFGFEWDGSRTAGNACSESYAGESPFDAVESHRLAEWARNETLHNNVEFAGFLDLHSYSQQILYPYSYSCKDPPPSQENLEELALGLEKAIRRSSGVPYEPMPACEGNVATSGPRVSLARIEAAGGSAIDWFYHEMHVRYAYQIKLRDRGTYGFLLPKENIVPTGKEVLEAVLYFGDFLREGYPKVVVEEEAPAENERVQTLQLDAVEELLVDDLLDSVPREDLKRRKKR